MKLGTQLRIARHGMNDGEGMTQKEVSEKTTIMPYIISGIENNTGNPQLSTIIKLCNFYGYELRINLI